MYSNDTPTDPLALNTSFNWIHCNVEHYILTLNENIAFLRAADVERKSQMKRLTASVDNTKNKAKKQCDLSLAFCYEYTFLVLCCCHNMSLRKA